MNLCYNEKASFSKSATKTTQKTEIRSLFVSLLHLNIYEALQRISQNFSCFVVKGILIAPKWYCHEVYDTANPSTSNSYRINYVLQ